MSPARTLAALAHVLPPERHSLRAASPGLPELPIAAPNTLAEAQEVLALARAERWSVWPTGAGSKLAWEPPPSPPRLLLSSANLRGVSAYEPADGTLSARTGTRWDELVTATRARHHLSPELAHGAHVTLGGALAAGTSGLDRLRHGPLRHQVLGMLALHADGSLVKSGGRVVKNVTGYDLHRLWCGSRGTLCFLLEATVRLYPAPDEVVVLHADCADMEDGLARSHALLRTGLQPLAVVLRGSARATRLAVVLAGRSEAVAGELDVLSPLVRPAETLRGAEAHAARARLREEECEDGAFAPLVASCRPSRLAAGLARLAQTTGALGLETHLRCQPLLASLEVRFPAGLPSAAQRATLARELAAVELTPRWRGDAPPPPSAPASLRMQRLKAALDPDGVFVRPHLA